MKCTNLRRGLVAAVPGPVVLDVVGPVQLGRLGERWGGLYQLVHLRGGEKLLHLSSQTQIYFSFFLNQTKFEG